MLRGRRQCRRRTAIDSVRPISSDIVDFEPRPLAEMATKGRIGLQGAHGGIPTRFRNIKIKSLD
jgi:hypothetical protein